MSTYHLVLIETSGNQAYIFQTNKRRENVGASEAVRQVGSEFVCDAVRAITGSSITPASLLDPQHNPSIFEESSKVEVIYATSGKGLCVVKDKDIARRIIRQVTLQARLKMPGLDVHGAISEEWNLTGKPAYAALSELHRRHGIVKQSIPTESGRFLRVPPVEDCATSGFPAANHDEKDPEPRPGDLSNDVFSQVALAKRSFISDWNAQKKELDLTDYLMSLKEYEAHEERMTWAATIHADVNGMGKIFTDLHEYLGAKDKTTDSAKEYFRGLRELSVALDDCTKESFRSAIEKCKTDRRKVPLIPLVVAGDDMTVVCDGLIAIDFALEFLRAFTTAVESGRYEALAKVADRAFGVKRFGIRAGVAFVKPHFPFYLAYDLAEALTDSVKNATTEWYRDNPVPFAAFDFHVHHASSAPNLDFRKERPFYNRPYVLTPVDDSFGSRKDDVAKHQWNLLARRIRALQETDERDGNRRTIPRSQLHAIRAALMDDVDAAKAQWKLIADRHPKVVEPFGEDFQTTLLDAMDLVEFYKAGTSTSTENPTS